MKTLYESKEGIVTEDENNATITAKRRSVRDFDGIPDSYVYTTTINYETGLFTSERCTGYFAKYYDTYKNREKAIEAAIREVGGNK